MGKREESETLKLRLEQYRAMNQFESEERELQTMAQRIRELDLLLSIPWPMGDREAQEKPVQEIWALIRSRYGR